MSAAVYLNELGVVCAAGNGKAALCDAMLGRTPLPGSLDECDSPGQPRLLGRVTVADADLSLLPPARRSRNNALMLAALAQIRPAVDAALARHAPERIGVVLGSSTSGIAESERAARAFHAGGALPADYDFAMQELGSPALALSGLLGLAGPALVVSTACSSGAKAIASAARLLRAGLCDVVITGGVDTLCGFTLAGFTALESVSPGRCNPMSANRCGIHLGEGAALFLMSREPGGVRLAGWGESSDAHHISAPDPSAAGALAAMREALSRAGIEPGQVDYINLHGTATVQNDAMESLAVHTLFGAGTPASSTKPLTGHTLGAAGAIEAAIGWLLLHDNPQGELPPQCWDGVADPALPVLNLVPAGGRLGRQPDWILSNSFAFGGSNAVLLLGRA